MRNALTAKEQKYWLLDITGFAGIAGKSGN